MSGPLVFPGARRLPPEYRWINIYGKVTAVMGIRIILVPFVMMWIVPFPGGIIAVLAPLIPLVVTFLTYVTFFKWALLLRAARREARSDGTYVAAYSFVSIARGDQTRIEGPGWILVTRQDLSLRLVPSFLGPFSSVETLEQVLLMNIDGAECVLHRGASPRLVIRVSSGEEIEVAMVAQTGRSLSGANVSTVEQAAKAVNVGPLNPNRS